MSFVLGLGIRGHLNVSVMCAHMGVYVSKHMEHSVSIYVFTGCEMSSLTTLRDRSLTYKDCGLGIVLMLLITCL